MAEEAGNELHTEPDAEFLDTFFDDGVLDTIEDVYRKAEHDDSSCEALDAAASASSVVLENKESVILVPSCHQPSQDSSRPSPGKKQGIIVLKPAHLTDPLKQHGIDIKSPECKQHDEVKHQQCPGKATLDNQNLNKTEQSEPSSSIDDLLTRVKKILKDVPVSGLKVSDQSKVDPQKESSRPLVQEEEKNVLVAMVKKCLANPPAFGLAPGKLSCNNSEDGADVPSEKGDSLKERKGENIKEVNLKSSLNSSSSPCAEEGVAVDASTDTKSKTVRDETERENGLFAEETSFRKIEQKTVPEKQNKINLNLKSQILAPTTIFNSGSSSAPEKYLTGSDKMKISDADSSKSSLLLRERHPSVSSISNDSLPDASSKQKNKKRKKRKSSCKSSDSNCSDCERSKDRSTKQKKRRRNDSPQLKRSRDNKKSRKSRRRSRSHSKSPYSSKRRKRKEKSPRRKRRRSWSFSVSPSPPNRRFTKHSPIRRRSRSRSNTSMQYRMRTEQHRKRSSRDKSPFINEISRLKRQWEREDEAKKGCSRYLQPRPEMLPAHVPSWRQETKSTIVSNMLSVSVESVEVHSASFSFGNAVDASQRFPASLPPGSTVVGPSAFGPLFMPPEYCNSNAGGSFPLHISSSNNFIPGPGENLSPLYNLDHAAKESQLALPTCVPPHQLTVPPPAPLMVSPISDTISPASSDVQPSILRKQLDILMSTVANLPDPRCTGKSGNNNGPITVSPANPITSTPHCTAVKAGISKGRPVNSSLVQTALQPNISKESISLSKRPSSEEGRRSITPNANPPPESEPCKPNSDSLRGNEGTKFVLEKEAGKEESTIEPAIASNTSEHPLPKCDSPCGGIQNQQQSKIEPASSDECVMLEYDSDVLVEELPPKHPVELICLSGDEADISTLHDLDKELHKIHEELDMLDQSGSTQGGAEEGIQNIAATEETIALPAPKKKRKRKRNRPDKGSMREQIVLHEGPSAEIEIYEDISSDSGESVLRECHDMIDSLRIGRFVLIDEDKQLDIVTAVDEKGPNSVLCSSKVEFSYTKVPEIQLKPQTKDISTNTLNHLLIDVCCGTDNTEIQKDFGTQTDLDCLECTERKEVIRELNVQLQSIKKERDNLLSIVLDKCQTIPGLDISSGQLQTDKGKKENNKFAKNLEVSSCFNNTKVILDHHQTCSNSWHSSLSAKSLSSQEMLHSGSCESFVRTKSVVSQQQGISDEPVLAYEYNHSSPHPRAQFQDRNNDYYCPRPFQ